MSSPKDQEKTSLLSNEVIDYWPSWSDWNREKLKEYLPGGKHERVDIINICFAIPQPDGSLKWNDERTDAEDPTKEIIRKLRAAGKKVLIAIGGASDRGGDIHWNLQTKGIKEKLTLNIKTLVDRYGATGADIDYEELKKREERLELIPFIKMLREQMPAGKYWLSYAAWSIGAYGENNKGHEHPEWQSGNEGIDIPIIKEVGHLFDHIFVMAYDAFDNNIKPNFNPIAAIEAYRALMNGRAEKIILGIEIGPQGWPANVKKTTQDARVWMTYAIKNGFGGAGFWTLDRDKIGETGEKNGAFMALTNELMPKSAKKLDQGDKKDVADQGDQKIKVDSFAQYQESFKKPHKDELIKLLGIGSLSENDQQSIIRIYENQQVDLKKLIDQHLAIRNERNKALEKADPYQKEALKQQFSVHDTQLNDHLKDVEKTFRVQLQSVIDQLRKQSNKSSPTQR